jgi:hypothetical protein
MELLDDAQSSGPAAPAAEATLTPTPAAAPATAPEAISPATWEQQLAAIEALIDQKIKTAIDALGLDGKLASLDALAASLDGKLAQIVAMIVSPADLENFIDRKIKSAAALAPQPIAAAPAPAQPVAPGATHTASAGDVGQTGAHGDLGSNKA